MDRTPTSRSMELESGSIPALLLRFSIPAIVGMLVQATYNVVDRIFIGRAMGSLGIAAITITFPVSLILMAFAMLIGLGATALVSMKLGARDKPAAEQILGNAAVLLVAVFVALAAAGFLVLNPLLSWLGASPDVLPPARDYMRIILLGAIFQGVGFGLNNVIRGEGNPKIAMATMLVGAITNVVLAPIFIFGFGWGIEGAALATILAQAVSAVWVLSYFLRGHGVLKIRREHLRLRGPICLAIIAIGSPPFAVQLAASLMHAILNNQLAVYGGDVAISVMGIVYGIVMMTLMPIFGVNQGAQPIIGFNYGARRFDRVKRTLVLAIAAATGVTVVGFIATMLFPGELVRLFNRDDPALIEMGIHAIRTCFLMLPVVGFQIVSANYFQAVGRPRSALFLSLTRQVLLLMPGLLIWPRLFGLNGVWLAMPISDLGASLITSVYMFLELRRLRTRHWAESENPATDRDVPPLVPPSTWPDGP
jgi:putative MATE family efflux protein